MPPYQGGEGGFILITEEAVKVLRVRELFLGLTAD
jgi:hypothetical protein